MYKDMFIKNIHNVHLLLNLLNNIYEIVYIIDKNGIYLGHSAISDVISAKYKVPKILTGKNIWELFPKKIADEYFNITLKILHENKPQILYKTYSARGEAYEELLYNQPIFNTTGKILGVMGKVINIEAIIYSTKLIKTAKNKVFENDTWRATFSELVFLIKQMEISDIKSKKFLLKETKQLLKTLLHVTQKEANTY